MFLDSYEGRVFINNPSANETTELNLENGYVGSYHVFGHGGCYGSEGHCDIPNGIRTYDNRPIHGNRPQYKRIIITDAMTGLFYQSYLCYHIDSEYPFHTTAADVVKFEKIGIIAYN